MRLALSSAAAPDATLAELASAARRRGLRALELVQGDAHGLVRPQPLESWAAAARTLRERQVAVCAVRCDDLSMVEECREGAAALGAPVLVPGPEAGAFRERLAALVAVGEAPVLAFDDPTLLLEAAEYAPAASCALAWEVLPGRYDLAAAAGAVLARTGSRLRHITLHGGGPEAVAQEGLGVGDLMRELALAGFAGSVALAPSAARYRVAWNTWLGRRGGWGCGSKVGARAALPVRALEAP